MPARTGDVRPAGSVPCARPARAEVGAALGSIARRTPTAVVATARPHGTRRLTQRQRPVFRAALFNGVCPACAPVAGRALRLFAIVPAQRAGRKRKASPYGPRTW